MKIRVKKKDLKESYSYLLGCGYCEIQYLLMGVEPDYYTCGTNGWNEDVYKIDNITCLTTGYNPTYNIRIDYKITRKYNEKARKIFENYNEKYNQRIKKIEKLRSKFIKEVMETQKELPY